VHFPVDLTITEVVGSGTVTDTPVEISDAVAVPTDIVGFTLE
jgi:hypothetical protein